MKINQKGFTLIEVLTVLTIIGILAILVTPKLNVASNNLKISNTETDIRAIQSNIQQFYIDHRHTAFTEEKVVQYMDVSFEKIATTSSGLLKFKTTHKEDPWGNPYYLYIQNTPTPYTIVHSYGSNEQDELHEQDFGDDILYLFYPETD